MSDENNASATLSTTDICALVVTEAEKPAPDTAKMIGWMQDLAVLLKDSKVLQDLQFRDQAFLVVEQRLVDMHDVPALVSLMRLRAKWSGNKIAYGSECAALLNSATKDRLVAAKIASSGLGRKAPVESLDRLSFLLSLAPGATVGDNVHGYGEVVAEDDFYKTVTVKFDSDPGKPRELGFAFAVDSVYPIDKKHVLAVRHADPAAFEKTLAEKPEEIVKLALASWGDMTVARLETLFTDLHLLPEGTDWKKFWSAVRPRLARDSAVSLPPAVKKNLPVELVRETAEQHAAAMAGRKLRDFAASRDAKQILEQAAEYVRFPGPAGFAPELAAAFTDRLSFVVKAAVADRRLGNRAKVQALVLACKAGVKALPVPLSVNDATRDDLLENFAFTDETCAAVDPAATLCKPAVVLDAAKTLPAGQMEELLSFIPLGEDPAVAAEFAARVPYMTANLVEHVAPKLLVGPAKDAFAALVRDQFSQNRIYNPEAPADDEGYDATIDVAGAAPAAEPASPGLSMPLLRWICHAAASEKTSKELFKVVSPYAIVTTAGIALGFQAEKENLRMKNDIRKLFVAGRRDASSGSKVAAEVDEGCKWLFPLMDAMEPEQRAAVFIRVNGTEGVWEPLKKRHLVANLVAKYPELAASAPAEKPAAAQGATAENVSSIRSIRERQAQYRHLMDVEMPQNRKDIEFAKGFGDLSENFEYESARAKERELVARQQKLEADLKRVSAYDFAQEADAEIDVAGLGSYVTLEFADGSRKSYALLGEWDSAPELGIISFKTPVARAVADHAAGNRVEIPSDGDEPLVATIVSIDPLPQEIVEWTRG